MRFRLSATDTVRRKQLANRRAMALRLIGNGPWPELYKKVNESGCEVAVLVSRKMPRLYQLCRLVFKNCALNMPVFSDLAIEENPELVRGAQGGAH